MVLGSTILPQAIDVSRLMAVGPTPVSKTFNLS